MFERLRVPVLWFDRLDAAYVERWSALRRDRDHAGHYNLVHDLELKRLRSELDATRRTQPSGIGAIIKGLKRRFRNSRE